MDEYLPGTSKILDILNAEGGAIAVVEVDDAYDYDTQFRTEAVSGHGLIPEGGYLGAITSGTTIQAHYLLGE